MRVTKTHFVLIIVLIFSLFIGSVDAEDEVLPPTSFIVNILDVETGDFISTHARVTIVNEYDGNIGQSVVSVTEPYQRIPSATIEGQKITVTAGAEGYRDSDPHVYIVSASSPNEGILFNHTFYLDPLPPTLVYIHIQNENNDSVENATVVVTAINRDENFSGQTDENGVFSFSAQFVNYEVNVAKEGYYDEQTTIAVDHNLTEINFSITLYEIPPTYHRMVYLTIKGPNGNPIEGATVNVHTYLYDVNLTNTTNENGIAVFELTSDDYLVTVSTDEYGTEEFGLWIGNEPTAWEGSLGVATGRGRPIEPQQPSENWVLIIIGIVALVCIIVFVMLFKRKRKPKEPES